ncbi:MAG: hypothetical protein ACREXT_04205, partial [Gammaproteobacteria bacterium]
MAQQIMASTISGGVNVAPIKRLSSGGTFAMKSLPLVSLKAYENIIGTFYDNARPPSTSLQRLGSLTRSVP